MLWVHVPRGTALDRIPVTSNEEVPETCVWFDLVNPNLQEDKIVEHKVGVAVPTREEMQEIEVNKLARTCSPGVSGESVLMELLDAVIDRTADILERVGAEVDQVSHEIFEPEDNRADRTRSYTQILRVIGRKGDLATKVRESLVSIGRLLLYLANEADSMRWAKEARAQLRGMQRDVHSLSDHAAYLSNKIQFLLDAMLGVVTIEQNNIIKIFSVAAVALMPPTLIASIYGMNFKHMPELDWYFGYPVAIVLMVLAAALPYFFFKWKKWL